MEIFRVNKNKICVGDDINPVGVMEVIDSYLNRDVTPSSPLIDPRDRVNPRVKGRDLVEVHQQQSKLSRYALLHAHGRSDDLSWKYYDRRRFHNVQDWVEEHDGRYSPLVILSCNPAAFKIRSAKSIIVYPLEITSPYSLKQGRTEFELYYPGTGAFIHPKRKLLDRFLEFAGV